MNRPLIFISAVTSELATVRRAAASTLHALGYDTRSQDDFPTGHGELRQWLREQIFKCDGLLQIVGEAYGAEPPDVDPDYGRVSYTQFEFFYARLQGKKTFIITAQSGCHRDLPSEFLDLPRDPAHQDPAAYQAERKALQQVYLQRLRKDNHLRHQANSDAELELILRRLPDELVALRQRTERSTRRLARTQLVILAAILLLGGGSWAIWRASRSDVAEIKSGLTVDAARLRSTLISRAENDYQRDLAEASAVQDWQRRTRLKDAAEAEHSKRLAAIEKLVTSFTELAAGQNNSAILDEFLRILDTPDQGVDAALAYFETSRPSILERVSMQTEESQRQLEPLLGAAEVALAAGRYDEAESLFRDILRPDHPNWPQARHEFWGFLVDVKGPSAQRHSTLASAQAIYEESERYARRLNEDEPENPQWQRDLSISHNRLGDVAIAKGDLAEAARRYAAGLAIAEKLAAADPGNTQWLRDLSISYERLGNVDVAQGNLDEATRRYAAGLVVREKLAAADPGNTEWRRDLFISHQKLGEVALATGDLAEAARRYAAGHAIAEKFAATDPGNTAWQRDLSISHDRLGDVARAKDDLAEAARRYAAGLAIAEKLAAADPVNTELQRDLSISHDRLGDVARAKDDLAVAARRYAAGLAVREKLAATDPGNTQWQSELSNSQKKLGEVAQAKGDLEEAAQRYTAALAITEKVAAADPGNTLWQQELYLRHSKLGDLAQAKGDLAEAARRYSAVLIIIEKLATADPGNTEWQRDRSISLERLGDVARDNGQLDKARTHYEECFGISERLIGIDKGNSKWWQDLARYDDRLGDVARATGDLAEAARRYTAALAIAEKFAAADPGNMEWQRDLWVSHKNLALLSEKQSDASNARRHWQAAHDVLDGIDRRGLHISPDDRDSLKWLKEKLATLKAE